MTFVIIGGGIDLSVGAILALSSVWATTLATQALAEDFHWIVMVFTAIVVGAGAGLVNGVVIAYGRLVAFIATLAMLVAARGLAEIIANRRTQIVQDRDFLAFFSGDVLGIPTLVIIWALVSIAGWVLLNRTTFGRRTFAVGGNAEAARLAGIRVQRHTVKLYVLSGVCCGIAAVMMMARTTTGSSTHGTLYELVRHRRRRHRRHPADRRSRHHRRHRPRRADLHHARQHLHAQQPVELGPGRRDRRDHRARRPAADAPGRGRRRPLLARAARARRRPRAERSPPARRPAPSPAAPACPAPRAATAPAAPATPTT